MKDYASPDNGLQNGLRAARSKEEEPKRRVAEAQLNTRADYFGCLTLALFRGDSWSEVAPWHKQNQSPIFGGLDR